MSGPVRLLRLTVLGAVLGLVAGCTAKNEITEPTLALGDFSMGYNVVVADNAEIVPPSRKATPEEWETALSAAIADRLGRYSGEKLYHIGVSVDGYALAVPGVPVLIAPKSALILTLNVWDDAAKRKLTDEPKRLTILESFSGETVIGTGLTKTREQQIENLAFNAARQIEKFLAENSGKWFGVPQDAAAAVSADVGPVAPEAAGASAGEMPPPAPGSAPPRRPAAPTPGGAPETET